MSKAEDAAYEVSCEFTDVEFVEFFAWLRKFMLNNMSRKNDMDSLTDKDIFDILCPVNPYEGYYSFSKPYKNFTDWLHNILREVICEDDIDYGAWWKHKEE